MAHYGSPIKVRGILETEILLLDGGLGTTLEDEHNVSFNQDTPLWSSHLLISDPFLLGRVQRDFANAGADIILTPSYQASHLGFQKTGVEDAEKYLNLAVDISYRTGKIVALSLGPYGAILQPSQEYSGDYGGLHEKDLSTFHKQRLDAITSWNKIDLVAFETIPRLDEIRIVQTLFDSRKPYWISCVFPRDNRLPDGSSIREILSALAQPWGIGINCTKVEKLAGLIEEYEREAESLKIKLPKLVIYPDGTNGQVYNTASQKWVGQEQQGAAWEDQVAQIVREVRHRAKWTGIVVGGCCKTSPQHIAKLKNKIEM